MYIYMMTQYDIACYIFILQVLTIVCVFKYYVITCTGICINLLSKKWFRKELYLARAYLIICPLLMSLRFNVNFICVEYMYR